MPNWQFDVALPLSLCVEPTIATKTGLAGLPRKPCWTTVWTTR